MFVLELIGNLEDDEEDIDFIDDDKSNKPKKNKYKGKDDITSLFASAEEFSTLLEDEGSSKIKPGGSNVYSNKDNASMFLIYYRFIYLILIFILIMTFLTMCLNFL